MPKKPTAIHVSGLQVGPAVDGRFSVTFDYDPEAVQRIKSMPGSRWHADEKRWSVPANGLSVFRLKELFVWDETTRTSGAPPTSGLTSKPTDEALQEKVARESKLRGYSPSTRKAYRHHLQRFCRHLEGDPLAVGEEEIRSYLLDLIERRGVSRSYLNQSISAIKFLYDKVLRTPQTVGELPRPRPTYRLPVVLSRSEVLRLLTALGSLKHRAILMMAYSSGLRVSEVVHLKVADIDGERGLLRVHRAKGRKDRYTPLSQVALQTLRQYWEMDRPRDWLFPGGRQGRHLTARSVQKVLERAVKKVGIAKRVTMHTLRHSYATHMLEDGTDLRYVQELLGHKRPETTMIYTHVTQKDIRRIRSPLDNFGGESD